MPIPPSKYELYRSLILSGQIEQYEVPKIMAFNPHFKAWYLSKSEHASPTNQSDT